MDDRSDYSFESFQEEFGFSFVKGSEEYTLRSNLFNKELARVRAHNMQGKSWKEGINKFSAVTPAEMKAFKGRSKGVAQKHIHQNRKPLPADFVMKPVQALPSDVDWRTAYPSIVSPVKDQGYCGSCWAFASTAVIESHVAKNSGLLYDLSVQQMAMCAPNPKACGGTGGCNGATAEIAFDYVASSKGMYQEYQQGYAAYRGQNSACTTPAGAPKVAINGYVQLKENNYTELMNAVALVGPIAISVDATWGSYSSGIFAAPLVDGVDIDHAVVLVGYGFDATLNQKYWLVRNSWSPSWGEKGYIRVLRTDNDENYCAIDNTPQDGTACAGDNTPVKCCGTSGILYDSAYPTGATAL